MKKILQLIWKLSRFFLSLSIKNNKKIMTTLYQYDQQKNIKIWTIEVIDHNIYAEIISTSGIEGGTMTPNVTIIDKGKGGRSIMEQAISQADSKIEKKIKEGYVDDINNIKESCDLQGGAKEPLLAYKYDPTGKQKGSKTLKQIGIENKKIAVQRKKDGNRCISRVYKDGLGFHCSQKTRKGESFAKISHIEEQLINCFKKIYNYVNEKYGVTEYTIDGEFMPPTIDGSKLFSFNKLNGLVKSGGKTLEEKELVKQIEYHIYDVQLPVGYETRDKIKNYFKASHLVPLETIYITATDVNLRVLLEKFLEEGEEGLMIRQLGMPYEYKRSWQLCKYKLFVDEEFEICGFQESVRKGMVGAVICKLNTPGKDRNGNPIYTFKAAMKMSHDERKEWWLNQSNYIGKRVTVEFFEYSEYLIPRFGKAKGLCLDH